ncbi:MAG TPA: tetratricopeptide repeat protein, partial [Terriglobales bacterium]|nr:tetratricopeptide repeat protein [Terriglobales bacterium]
KAAFDTRRSIGETLSATIASGGLDVAVRQYNELKAAGTDTYNFDERELNDLGYKLLQRKQFKEAIRIFQLNVEAYPHSSNVYDSLGEAYMDDGNRLEAVANYKRSLRLNPKNYNAAVMLQKLNAPLKCGQTQTCGPI